MSGEKAGGSVAKRYEALIEIKFHLGELYFLMPFLHALDRHNRGPLCLLFTNRRAYLQFERDSVLKGASEQIGAEVRCHFSEPAPLLWRLVRKIAGINRKKRNEFVRLLSQTDLCLIQIGGGSCDKMIASLAGKRPRIVRFPHTSSPALFDLSEAKKQNLKKLANPGESIIVWDPDAAPYYALMGFERSAALGYHCLGEKWIEFLKSLERPSGPYALIFSYRIRDDVLPLDKWKLLHQSSYRAIRRVFPNIKIIIKPHPKQDEAALRRVVDEEGWTNTFITNENPMLLSSGASFAISYLTGGIYNAMLLNVPAINYFNAREEYKRGAGRGSYKHDFEALGVPDVQDEEGLVRELQRIRDGDAQASFGVNKKQIPLVTTFDQLKDMLEGAYPVLTGDL